MKKLFTGLILILIILAVAAPALADGSLTRISEHVYAYQDAQKASPANSFGANAGIIVGETGIVVVDTLATAKEAHRLIADIRKITDKPILYAVLTHFHFDHALGSSEFVKQGAIIVSHTNCLASLENYGENIMGMVQKMGLSKEDLDGATVVYPTLTFTDAMSIHLGNVTAEIKFVASGHAPGSILIHVPEEKVLFAGDNLFTNFHAYLATADLDGWQKNLDYILGLGAEKIIPGHGPLSNNEDVAAEKEYLAIFDQKAKELCAASDNLDEIVATLEKELPQKAQGVWMIRANVQGKYFNNGKNQECRIYGRSPRPDSRECAGGLIGCLLSLRYPRLTRPPVCFFLWAGESGCFPDPPGNPLPCLDQFTGRKGLMSGPGP